MSCELSHPGNHISQKPSFNCDCEFAHPGKLPEGPDSPLGGGDVVDDCDAQHGVEAVVLHRRGEDQPISFGGEY